MDVGWVVAVDVEMGIVGVIGIEVMDYSVVRNNRG